MQILLGQSRITAMLIDYERDTHFLCVHGSRAYGTNNPDSDHDVRGIAVPPLRYFIGTGVEFSQYVGKKPPVESEKFSVGDDFQIWNIRKFVDLCIKNNPNALEILFVSPNNVLFQTDLLNPIFEIADQFLSKRCRHTFAGYAHSQLKRIRSHRNWLLNPPTKQPTRTEFGLPENPGGISSQQIKAAHSLVDKQIEHWFISPDQEIPVSILERARENMADLIASMMSLKDKEVAKKEIQYAACHKMGFADNFSEYIVKEKAYLSAKRHWQSYQQWKEERNKSRADTEAKFGYDTKHGMHLVRLMRMCVEILRDEKCIVRRPDAEELLSIRNGEWSFDKLVEFAEEKDREADSLYKISKLPRTANIKNISKALEEVIVGAAV